MTDTEIRVPLTRRRIIDGAVVFADRHGVEELSMRKLGAELGVEAMSLYNHVANKDDILEGMIESVVSAIALPELEAGWKASFRLAGTAAVAQLLDHPWVVNLILLRGTLSPAILAFMERTVAILSRAGFSDEEAHHAWHLLASHTLGYVMQQEAGAFGGAQWANFKDRVEALAAGYPNVARLAPYMVDCDPESEYAFGLDVIIGGLATRLP